MTKSKTNTMERRKRSLITFTDSYNNSYNNSLQLILNFCEQKTLHMFKMYTI